MLKIIFAPGKCRSCNLQSECQCFCTPLLVFFFSLPEVHHDHCVPHHCRLEIRCRWVMEDTHWENIRINKRGRFYLHREKKSTCCTWQKKHVGEEKRGNHFLVCVGCEHLSKRSGLVAAWGGERRRPLLRSIPQIQYREVCLISIYQSFIESK